MLIRHPMGVVSPRAVLGWRRRPPRLALAQPSAGTVVRCERGKKSNKSTSAALPHLPLCASAGLLRPHPHHSAASPAATCPCRARRPPLRRLLGGEFKPFGHLPSLI